MKLLSVIIAVMNMTAILVIIARIVIMIIAKRNRIMPEYIDINKWDFRKAFFTTYTGGSTWMKLENEIIVFPGIAPLELCTFFDKYPYQTYRGEIYHDGSN